MKRKTASPRARTTDADQIAALPVPGPEAYLCVGKGSSMFDAATVLALQQVGVSVGAVVLLAASKENNLKETTPQPTKITPTPQDPAARSKRDQQVIVQELRQAADASDTGTHRE